MLPGVLVEEIHSKRSMRDCIVWMEAGSSKLNATTVHISFPAAVFHVVKKFIVICRRLCNAPRVRRRPFFRSIRRQYCFLVACFCGLQKIGCQREKSGLEGKKTFFLRNHGRLVKKRNGHFCCFGWLFAQMAGRTRSAKNYLQLFPLQMRS